MNKLDVVLAEINIAFTRLVRQWEVTKSQWKDPVQKSFEQEYWEPLTKEILETQRQMENLIKVVSQAERYVK